MTRFMREHFLADLAKREGFTRMAELGVWKGRTFFHLLENCPGLTLFGVDAWKYRPGNDAIPGGETYSKWNMEWLKRHVTEGAKPYGDRAIILNMETWEAAEHVADGSLDCIFIDADHTSEGVRRDIETWRPKIREGGFVTGHDWSWPSVQSVVVEYFPNARTAVDDVWWARA